MTKSRLVEYIRALMGTQEVIIREGGPAKSAALERYATLQSVLWAAEALDSDPDTKTAPEPKE